MKVRSQTEGGECSMQRAASGLVELLCALFFVAFILAL